MEKIPVEVRVNINGPKDAEVGLKFGADGVGFVEQKICSWKIECFKRNEKYDFF